MTASVEQHPASDPNSFSAEVNERADRQPTDANLNNRPVQIQIDRVQMVYEKSGGAGLEVIHDLTLQIQNKNS